MKKICSRCGNQLDLSNRFCPSCSAHNPFFIAGFSGTKMPEGNGELLLLEKKRIEIELAEQERVEHEMLTQAQLKKEQEEVEKKYRERQEAEKLERERIEKARIEREKAEAALKTELLKVKEETEQYKNETLNLVKEVRSELQHIEEENKRLQREFTSITQTRVAEQKAASPSITPVAENKKTTSRITIAISVLLVAMVCIFGYTHFFGAKNNPAQSTATMALPSPPDNTPIPAPLYKPNSKTVATKPPAGYKPESAKPATYDVTASRVERDLVNRTLSGCGITIRTVNDIDYISNLVLIERIPSGSTKYKFTVKITQGGETHTASPYIYYNADGTFNKIDGTNCD